MIVSRRSVAAGGTSIIHVEGHVPAPFVGVTGGNPQWRTDSLLVAQTIRDIDGVTKARLEQWNYDDPKAPLELVSERGQNFMFAGGGQFAAWAGFYYDSYGPQLSVDQSDWAPLAVDDETGLIAVILNRSRGSGLGIWNGETLTIVERGMMEPEASFKNAVLLYRTPGEFRVWSPNPVQPPGQVPIRGVCHSKDWRLGFQDDKGLLIYGWTARIGLQLHLPGESFENDFDFNMITRDDGLIRVVSSRLPGNNPEDLRSYIVDPVAGTVNGEPRPWRDLFSTATTPPVEPPPIDLPKPPIELPKPPIEEPDMPLTPKNRERYENKLADCAVQFLKLEQEGALSEQTRQEFWQGIHEEGDRYVRTPELSWSGRALSLAGCNRYGAASVTLPQEGVMDPWFDAIAEIDAVELQRK